ncbi:MAG: DUF3883 domain-containing protein [Verrucomicrobiales bacterium]
MTDNYMEKPKRRRFTGQRQPIYVAIHKLVRDYPLDEGLFKEFIQNADDAGASQIEFIIDRRTHPSNRIIENGLAILNDVALVIRNDAVFTDADLDNIEKVGDSSKLKDPSKTGRFGHGFNVCYNVTDYPCLITGRSFLLFDPHQTACSHTRNEPGYSFDLSEFENENEDLLAPFDCVGISPGQKEFQGTVFRLPLRNTEQNKRNGKIKKDIVTCDNLVSLVLPLSRIAPHILLFLKHLNEVIVREIATDGTERTLLRVTSKNAADVKVNRNHLLSFLSSTDILGSLDKIENAEEEEVWRDYDHFVEVINGEKKESHQWKVVSGFTRSADGALIEHGKDMAEHDEKALPWVAVAALIGKQGHPEEFDGTFSCFLPLPRKALLTHSFPVHLHALVDINTSRDGLTDVPGAARESTDELRTQWNRLITSCGLPVAYRRLLESVVEHEMCDSAQLYELFPQISEDGSFFSQLSQGLYEILEDTELFRVANGEKVTAQVGRIAPTALQAPLESEAWGLVFSPPIPDHIIAGFSQTEFPLQGLSPAEVREYFRVEEDACLPLEEAESPALRSQKWVDTLFRFCIEDSPGSDLVGCPMLLLDDQKLHSVGKLDHLPVFIASTKQRELIWPETRFIDANFVSRTNLKPIPEAAIEKLTAPNLIESLSALLNPSGNKGISLEWDPASASRPNEMWLISLLKFLNGLSEEEFGEALKALPNLPFVPSQAGTLHCSGLTTTPLLIGDLASYRILEPVINHFSVSLITGGTELLSQFRTFLKKGEDLGKPRLWRLTAVDLVDSISANQEKWENGETLFDPTIHGALLKFLESQLSKEDFVGSKLGEKLGSLPLFPTIDGKVIAVADRDCMRLGSHVRIPDIIWRRAILNPDFGGRLLDLLDVPVLGLPEFIQTVLLEEFSSLSEDDQSKVSEWLRLHYAQALKESGEERSSLEGSIANAPLIRCTDGEIYSPRAVYDPRVQVVIDVLGDSVPYPDLECYPGKQTDWLNFFTELGIQRTPRARDLAAFILSKVEVAKETESSRSVDVPLTRILEHIIENPTILSDEPIQDELSGGNEVPFFKFLQEIAWCPALRAEKELRRYGAWKIHEEKLYYLAGLYPRQKGSLIASQRPLLPYFGRSLNPNLAKSLGIPWDPPSHDVANHFDRVLESLGGNLLTDSARQMGKRVLGQIYSFIGSETDGNPNEIASISLGSSIWERFDDIPCILDGSDWKLKKPRRTFRAKSGSFPPFTASVSYPQEPKIETGLTTLGRREAPDAEDLSEILVDISEAYHDSCSTDEMESIHRMLRAIASKLDERGDAAETPPEIRVPSQSGFLFRTDEVLDMDDPWLEERLQIGDDYRLHTECPPSLHNFYKLPKLSKARQTPRSLTDSEDKAFITECSTAERLIRHPAFILGVARIITKTQRYYQQSDIDWLSKLSIRATQEIICDYSIGESDKAVSLGAAESDFFFDPNLGAGGVLYISEETKGVFHNRLANALARELTDGEVDEASLIGILGCEPDEIDQILYKLHIPDLRQSDSFAEADGEYEESSSSFFGDVDNEDEENEELGSRESGEKGGKAKERKDSATRAKRDAPASGTSGARADSNEDRSAGSAATGDENEDNEDVPVENSIDGSGASETSGSSHPPSRSGSVGAASDHNEGGTSKVRAHRRTLGSRRGRMTPDPNRNPRDTSQSSSRAAPKDRLISYVATKDQAEEAETNGESSNDELPENHSIGNAAVGWVLQYEKQQGRKPLNMAHANPGYDIESKRGRVIDRYIEVKGMAGEWGSDGVPLSAIQFEHATEKGDAFWLYVVEYAKDPKLVTIHMIQNPSSKATQFRFDHGWQHVGERAQHFRPSSREGMKLRKTLDDGGFEEGEITSVEQSADVTWLQVRFVGQPAKRFTYNPAIHLLVE